MEAEVLLVGMPWLWACATVFRTTGGTCKVGDRWTNIDMAVISRGLEASVCAVDADYAYPSWPHRPVTLRVRVEAEAANSPQKTSTDLKKNNRV